MKCVERDVKPTSTSSTVIMLTILSLFRCAHDFFLNECYTFICTGDDKNIGRKVIRLTVAKLTIQKMLSKKYGVGIVKLLFTTPNVKTVWANILKLSRYCLAV